MTLPTNESTMFLTSLSTSQRNHQLPFQTSTFIEVHVMVIKSWKLGQGILSLSRAVTLEPHTASTHIVRNASTTCLLSSPRAFLPPQGGHWADQNKFQDSCLFSSLLVLSLYREYSRKGKTSSMSQAHQKPLIRVGWMNEHHPWPLGWDPVSCESWAVSCFLGILSKTDFNPIRESISSKYQSCFSHTLFSWCSRLLFGDILMSPYD